MAYHLEFFPESFIALNQEVSNHPELCRLLAKHPPQETEIRMAEIATYCDIVLDGYYTPEDLEKLADILTKKLKAKNSIIILPH